MLDKSSDISLETLGAAPEASAPTSPYHSGKKDSGMPSSIEERAVALLGSGVSSEQTASALGISASRVSQLLAEKTFSDKVTSLRYERLQKHNTRDGKYDTLEDQLLEKLEKSLPLMMRPGEILKSLQVVNAAKRRGQLAPTQIAASQTIVSLVLPVQITQRFSTNTHNQVVSTGKQDLVTMQSSQLLSLSEDHEAEAISNEQKDSPSPAIHAELDSGSRL